VEASVGTMPIRNVRVMSHRIEITGIVRASAAVLLLGALAAHSVELEPAGDVALERGEWRRAGPSFACMVPAARQLPPSAVNPETLMLACMHLGPFVIRGPARTLASVLGPPHRTLPPQPKGAQVLLWFLGEPERYPYFVATVLNERIAALQVTGVAPAKGYSFNHINIGDSTQTLTEHFGPAFRVAKSDQPDTDVWSYPPWPFSFEVKVARVTSIRINDPAQ
jgi:hypothetical protein